MWETVTVTIQLIVGFISVFLWLASAHRRLRNRFDRLEETAVAFTQRVGQVEVQVLAQSNLRPQLAYTNQRLDSHKAGIEAMIDQQNAVADLVNKSPGQVFSDMGRKGQEKKKEQRGAMDEIKDIMKQSPDLAALLPVLEMKSPQEQIEIMKGFATETSGAYKLAMLTSLGDKVKQAKIKAAAQTLRENYGTQLGISPTS